MCHEDLLQVNRLPRKQIRKVGKQNQGTKYSVFPIHPDRQTLLRVLKVFSRRLEDKIRQLCVLAKDTNDDDAWLILSELRILLQQHIEHLRVVAAGKLSGTREFVERRVNGKSA